MCTTNRAVAFFQSSFLPWIWTQKLKNKETLYGLITYFILACPSICVWGNLSRCMRDLDVCLRETKPYFLGLSLSCLRVVSLSTVLKQRQSFIFLRALSSPYLFSRVAFHSELKVLILWQYSDRLNYHGGSWHSARILVATKENSGKRS